ncbi:MAG: hypothetical protein HKN33_18720 [Pyrinomonadaceae bacterium]|nr:hypothetical protein [Pyrinomonadaceae bacterium]
MKFLLPLLLLTLVGTGIAAAPSPREDEEIRRKLIGVWQNSKGVASGLTDHYKFYKDGRYVFNYNEMDGTKRLLSHSGFWNVHRGRLHIHTNRVALHLGGRWVKSSGSIATEYEIEGGRIITKSIAPVEKKSYSISSIVLEEEMYTKVDIDGEKFYKLSSDPETY